SSGARPMPRRTARSVPPRRTGRPWKRMRPDALRAPYTASMISERPEPTRPASPTISPACTVKDTPEKRPGAVRASTRRTSGPRLGAGLGARGAGRADALRDPARHRRDDLRRGGVPGGQADRGGAAVLHHRHPVADLADLLQPVGDVDDGDALGGELPDDPEE